MAGIFPIRNPKKIEVLGVMLVIKCYLLKVPSLVCVVWVYSSIRLLGTQPRETQQKCDG